MMDVLDERLHPLADRAFPFSVADPCKFVAGERLLEHGYQWTVSREVHSARFAQRPSACRNVQADERLPGTRYARDEHYGFLVVLARAFDDLLDTDRRQAQILGSSIVTRDCLNRVPCIERPSRFDDRRRRLIRGGAPCLGIDRRSAALCETVLKDASEVA